MAVAHPLRARPRGKTAGVSDDVHGPIMVWPPNGTRGCAGGERIPPADLDVYTLCCLDLGLDLWLRMQFSCFWLINLHAFVKGLYKKA